MRRRISAKADNALATSSSQYAKSKTVRNRVAKAEFNQRPPYSKVHAQSTKPIPRSAGRLSYDGTGY